MSRLPAVLIENIVESFVSGSMKFDGVVNSADNSTIASRSPRQVEYTMTLVMVASRNLELLRLVEAVESSLRRDPMITSTSLGDTISAMISGPLTLTPAVADLSHAHEARLEIRLRGCNKWIYQPETVFGIDKLALSGDFSANVT